MASSAVRRVISGFASFSLLVELSAAKTVRSSVWAVVAGVKRSSVFILCVLYSSVIRSQNDQRIYRRKTDSHIAQEGVFQAAGEADNRNPSACTTLRTV